MGAGSRNGRNRSSPAPLPIPIPRSHVCHRGAGAALHRRPPARVWPVGGVPPSQAAGEGAAQIMQRLPQLHHDGSVCWRGGRPCSGLKVAPKRRVHPPCIPAMARGSTQRRAQGRARYAGAAASQHPPARHPRPHHHRPSWAPSSTGWSAAAAQPGAVAALSSHARCSPAPWCGGEGDGGATPGVSAGGGRAFRSAWQMPRGHAANTLGARGEAEEHGRAVGRLAGSQKRGRACKRASLSCASLQTHRSVLCITWGHLQAHARCRLQRRWSPDAVPAQAATCGRFAQVRTV